jgi:hypothetical protein
LIFSCSSPLPIRKLKIQLGAIDLVGLWNVNTDGLNIQMNKLTGVNVVFGICEGLA